MTGIERHFAELEEQERQAERERQQKILDEIWELEKKIEPYQARISALKQSLGGSQLYGAENAYNRLVALSNAGMEPYQFMGLGIGFGNALGRLLV